jgi:3-phosphoshikimate 1-carboxyvinyltransferase
MAKGNTQIENILHSEDIEVMMSALNKLGVTIDFDKRKNRCRVTGINSEFNNPSSVPMVLNMVS